jgi:carboxypeptidase PM20D1
MVAPIVPPPVDERRAAEHLSSAVRFQTISRDLAPSRFHGTDERISVENYVEMIRFYETLIRHAAGVN